MRALHSVLVIACGLHFGITCGVARATEQGAQEQLASYRTHHDRRHGHDHVYPDRGAIIREVPRSAATVNYAGLSFRVSDGIWFEPRGPAFIVVMPPIGVVVPVVPAFATVIQSGGEPYLYANDVYYRARPDLGGYEVVNDPIDYAKATTAPAPAPAPAAAPALPSTAAAAAPAGVPATAATAQIIALPTATVSDGVPPSNAPVAAAQTLSPQMRVDTSPALQMQAGAPQTQPAAPPNALTTPPPSPSPAVPVAPTASGTVAAVAPPAMTVSAPIPAPTVGLAAPTGAAAASTASTPSAPAATATSPPAALPVLAAASAGGKVFAFPRSAKSPDEQARDHYECYRFAVAQSGFDPMRPGAGNSAAPGSGPSDYSRAQAACFEGRGYTVH